MSEDKEQKVDEWARKNGLPDGWPRDKYDLMDDWNRAMRGYKPSIWDPYKGEAEKLESLGLKPTARNNMLLTLWPLWLILLLLFLGLIAATPAPAQSPVDRCEAESGCRYLCPPGRHCMCICERGDPYRPGPDSDPYPTDRDRRPRRPNYCPPRQVACDFNPNDPCCWR